jgi:hypothetical protein
MWEQHPWMPTNELRWVRRQENNKLTYDLQQKFVQIVEDRDYLNEEWKSVPIIPIEEA